jgi:hypothetical protein
MNVYLFEVIAEMGMARVNLIRTALVFASTLPDAVRLLDDNTHVVEFDKKPKYTYHIDQHIDECIVLEKEEML